MVWGQNILDGLGGLGRFIETKVPKGTELSASAATRRGPTALKRIVKALRRAGGTPTEKYEGAGLAVLRDAPKLPLSFRELDTVLLCAVAAEARSHGWEKLARAGPARVATRMDYGNLRSMRTFVDCGAGGGSKRGRGADVWQTILDMAADGDGDSEGFVKWTKDIEPCVSKAYGEPMKVKSATAVRVEHEGFSAPHGDGPSFHARTVSVVMEETGATKRVSVGLARDNRPGWKRRLLSGVTRWIYLGDLVLRNKDTYIGDRVAMGGERVGGGLFSLSWPSALVHRVNPVKGAEWVLIIDWIPVQE